MGTTESTRHVGFKAAQRHALAAAVVRADGMHGLACVIVARRAAGWLYRKATQQVPFTKRRHIVVLPCWAEAALGPVGHAQYMEQQWKEGHFVLPAHDRDTELVTKVASRLIAAMGQGGGYQQHLQHCRWQVSVLENSDPYAVVLPGGEIIVHTGLLRLIRNDEDVLAMVLGHEMGHALARHTAERSGLHMVFAAGALVFAYLWYEAERQDMAEQNEELQKQGKPTATALQQPEVPSWFTEKVVPRIHELVVELPHSCRNEFEADLIGLKLMTLAKYNPKKAPAFFEELAVMERRTPSVIARLVSTHPWSTIRAEALRAELSWMQSNGDRALTEVGT